MGRDMTYSKDTWRGKTKDQMRRERGEKKGSCDRNGGWREGGEEGVREETYLLLNRIRKKIRELFQQVGMVREEGGNLRGNAEEAEGARPLHAGQRWGKRGGRAGRETGEAFHPPVRARP